MALENKLGAASSEELARAEEKISKKKAAELFEKGYLDSLEAGSYKALAEIHRYLFGEIYEFAGQVRDTEIKHILNGALTDKIHDREIYMKGIDYSYYYEGYTLYRTEEL